MKVVFNFGRGVLFSLVLGLGGCGSDDESGKGADGLEDGAVVAATYAAGVRAQYGLALNGATALDSAIQAFVAAPDAARLSAAQQAWRDARPEYLKTEAYRFYGGPIDDDDGPEGRINAWPMDEAYLDYVEGDATSGIINDPAAHPTLDAATLAALNEKDGEANIASGYHAIEFLLWGQDLSPTGAGARPFTDYLSTGGTAANQARRQQYLAAASQLLLTDLADVRQQWTGTGGDYAATFVAKSPKESIGLILQGIGSLSGAELGGERMQVAYDTKSQEDEHSCFSDNTHVDHEFDQVGIMDVYFGRAGGVDGPGIDELVEKRDPALNARVTQQMNDTLAAIQAIPRPFDQAILGDDAAPGRVKIKAAIDALREQTKAFAEVAKLLDVPLNLE